MSREGKRRSAMRVYIAFWWCVLVIRPMTSLGAQPTQQIANNRIDPLLSDTVLETPQHVLPAQLASITTDTGSLAPGHREFSHYTTPSLCLAAVKTAQDEARRTMSAQADDSSLQQIHFFDSLSSTTVTVARSCTARLTMAKVPDAELPSLLALALAANDDTLAHTIFGKQVSHAATDSARLAVMLNAMDIYLAARPARIAVAESLVTQLDTHHPRWQTERVRAHGKLLGFWRLAVFDLQALRREADRVIALVNIMPVSALRDSGGGDVLVNAYSALLWSARVTSPDSVPMIAQRAKRDLGRIPLDSIWTSQGRSVAKGHGTLQVIGDRWATISLDELVRRLDPPEVKQTKGYAQIPTDFWFPQGDDTVPGLTGAVRVVYTIDGGCLSDNEMPLYNYHACIAPMLYLQDWLQRYHQLGLRVTVIASLHGRVLFRGPEPMAEEAKEIAWYVQQYWHLPVSVAVRKTVNPSAAGEMDLVDRSGRTIMSVWRESYGKTDVQDRDMAIMVASALHRSVPSTNISTHQTH